MGGDYIKPEKIGEIFEDILPASKVAEARMSSITERKLINSYIRAIFIKSRDGEMVNFLKNGHKSEITTILSRMKVVQVNPYHMSYLTNNILRTLPDNFILFKSCYPIKYEKRVASIKCSEDSMSINIRVYAMNIYDEMCYWLNKVRDTYDKRLSNIWREILFYQFLREDIIKPKHNPHFIMIHSYYITDNETIDFAKLKKLKDEYFNKRTGDDIKNNTIDNLEKSLFEVINNGITVAHGKLLENQEFIGNYNFFEKNIHRLRLVRNRLFDDETKKEINLFMPSKKCIVSLTESPDQSILQWCLRNYIISDGIVRKQTTTGLHSDDEWMVIIFQLFSAFYTMNKKRFTTRILSWHENIFIKSFGKSGGEGHWKYVIGGVEFYVPNLGDMVMIDSVYKKVDNALTDSFENHIMFNEIVPHFFDDSKGIYLNNLNFNYTTNITSGNNINTELENVLKSNFNNLFNPQVFTEFEKLNLGFVKPNNVILSLMDEVNKINFTGIETDCETLLKEGFIKKFHKFLHPKLGTNITELESKQIYPFGTEIENTNVGEMLIYKSISGIIEVKKWVIMFDTKSYTVIDKLGSSVTVKSVNKNSLAKFNGSEINMNFDYNNPIINDQILDIYNI